MIATKLWNQIEKLDAPDRIELVEALCENLLAEESPLTPAQMTELNRRLELYGDSVSGISWKELKQKLRRKRKDAPNRHSAPGGTGGPRSSRLARKGAKRTRREV